MTQFNVVTFNGLLKHADTAVLQLQEYVVGCPGTTREFIRAAVVAFVKLETGTTPYASRKGGALTFKHASTEAKRVDNLMVLIYSVPKVGEAKKANPAEVFARAVKAAKKGGLTKAQAVRAFEKAWN